MRALRPSLAFALLLLLGIAVLVAIVPLLPGYDPYTQNLGASLLAPGDRSLDGRLYLLGTDTLGRDTVSYTHLTLPTNREV